MFLANIQFQEAIKQIKSQKTDQQEGGRSFIELDSIGNYVEERNGDQNTGRKAHKVDDIGPPPGFMPPDHVDANGRHQAGR